MHKKSKQYRKRYTFARMEISDPHVSIHIGDEPVWVSHFPYKGDSGYVDRFVDWRLEDDGSWLLCGHVHEKWRQMGKQINVGIDSWGGSPVSEDMIKEIGTDRSELKLIHYGTSYIFDIKLQEDGSILAVGKAYSNYEDGFLAKLDEDAQKFDIQELAFDRWGATLIIQKIEEQGLTVAQFGQGFASMAAPTKELEKMVLGCSIAHGNNPVLSWMADNVVVRQDPAGNLKPDKEKSIEKIDGIVALIMALDRSVRVKIESVYETRGVVVL
jgi:phage terminase large subunit-like protein